MKKEAVQLITPDNLVEELQAGNRRALAYLYDHYGGALYGVLLKMLRQDEALCQDLLQEIFVKIWQKAKDYSADKGALYTWLVNITRNHAIDYLRSKRHKNQQQNHSIDNSVYGLESARDWDPQHIGLNELVSQLQEEQQQIIHLAYFQGFTQQEIAEEHDIPLGTVKSRARAGLQRLKKYFNPER